MDSCSTKAGMRGINVMDTALSISIQAQAERRKAEYGQMVSKKGNLSNNLWTANNKFIPLYSINHNHHQSVTKRS